MADTQPNPDISAGASGMTTPNKDQFPPVAVEANRGSDYRMVELDRMKPYCLQLLCYRVLPNSLKKAGVCAIMSMWLVHIKEHMWTIGTCPTTVLLSTMSECVYEWQHWRQLLLGICTKCDVDLYAPQGVDLGEGGFLSYWCDREQWLALAAVIVKHTWKGLQTLHVACYYKSHIILYYIYNWMHLWWRWWTHHPHLHMRGHQELWQTSSGQSCLTSMKLPLQ